MSRYLLDTHVFIWQAQGNSRIPLPILEIIRSSNQLFLSYASIWEMSIKVSLGKLAFDSPFPELVQEEVLLNQYTLLPIEIPHLFGLGTLPFHHKDPFDRLLIAQAQAEHLPILSADPALDAYAVTRIW